MGLFSKLFSSNRSAESKRNFSYIIDIAALITNNDAEIMGNLQKCVDDPLGYGRENSERYAERGIDISDETDINEICWIGMVDELAENGYLFTADFSEESDVVLWGLSQLKNYSLIEKCISENALDKREYDDVENLAQEISNNSDNACICMIDIDSDSYELIITSRDTYSKISDIAGNNGHSIKSF